MHQNTQFHIEKQKKLHTVGGGTPPPPPPPPSLGRYAPSQEVFRKFGMLPVASLNKYIEIYKLFLHIYSKLPWVFE